LGLLVEQCAVRNYRVEPCRIHYLRSIIEAYPGLAVVSTVDPAIGLVRIAIPPGCEPDVRRILEAEREILKLAEVGEEA
jgi:hypothetical protein